MASDERSVGSLVLGVDIGGTGIKGALVDVSQGTLATERCRFRTPQPATPEAVVRTVARIATHLDWQGTVGCTMPARVRRGVAETAVNIDPAWVGTDVVELLRTSAGLQATVLNDADAAAIAEVRFGAAHGQTGTVVLLTLGTGIGSALFAGGRLVPNTELGQLELGSQVIEEWASNAVRKREGLSWVRWAGRLQKVLEHVEFIFAPDMIVIGGGVSRPHRWARFSDRLRTRCRLEPARLENEAGLIGAAWAAAHPHESLTHA